MSKMLYEGQRVCLSRYAGPANEGPDRRRYQLTLMLLRAGIGGGIPIACAWVSLTREELRQVAEAIHGAEASERWDDPPPDPAPNGDGPHDDRPGKGSDKPHPNAWGPVPGGRARKPWTWPAPTSSYAARPGGGGGAILAESGEIR